MPFDVVSFIAGVAAGALTGGLAVVLHRLEEIADIQQRVRQMMKEVQKLNSDCQSQVTPEHEAKLRLSELQGDLEEIQEEIRRMYKSTSH